MSTGCEFYAMLRSMVRFLEMSDLVVQSALPRSGASPGQDTRRAAPPVDPAFRKQT